MKPPTRAPILLCLALLFLLSGCGDRPADVPTLPPAPATAAPSPTRRPPPPTAAPTPSETPYPLFWDDLTDSLEPGWGWVRENDALWSLTSEPGFLRIVLEGASLPRNLLLRDVASENFQITTHVIFTPTSNFQGAGLIVYGDDETRISLVRAFCDVPGNCVGNGVYFDRIEGGAFSGTNFGMDTQLKDEAYLRIDKQGSLYTAYYSDDGATWQTVGQHELAMAEPKVGLTTGGSHVVGATALFDYFGLQEMP